MLNIFIHACWPLSITNVFILKYMNILYMNMYIHVYSSLLDVVLYGLLFIENKMHPVFFFARVALKKVPQNRGL